MTIAAPWLLLALAALPALWWLLRITPPAPRRQVFPAVGLLLGLQSAEAAARTPLWLLALRLVAAAGLIVGLANPVRRPKLAAIADPRPLLLIIDNGWASAGDWRARIQAARQILAQASTSRARLLPTARDSAGLAPALGPAQSPAELAASLDTMRPQPWPTDHAAAAAALAGLTLDTQVAYVADSEQTQADPAWLAAVARFGRVIELRGAAPILLLTQGGNRDGWVVRARSLPGAPAVELRARAADGSVLAAAPLAFDSTGLGSVRLVLPPALLRRVASFGLSGPATAAATVLLDDPPSRRGVGLLVSPGAEDQPLVGRFYYLRRALAPIADLHEGNLAALRAAHPSVLITTEAAPADSAALAAWVEAGGLLIRFAAPDLAADQTLLPVPLLAGDRTLGGAMSWTEPAALAPFPPGSPFAGLAIPPDVRIARQILAAPGEAPDHPGRLDWASLTDGTPLVTTAPLGAGRIVLFHVTATADWSTLPLSGVFLDMLSRLIALSAATGASPAGAEALTPRLALDGFGQPGPPGSAATALPASTVATTLASPHHPPGRYGPSGASRALNLGDGAIAVAPAGLVPGAALRNVAGPAPPLAFGPTLLAAALALLALDGVLTLRLRGLLLLALLAAGPAARADDLPALATHLGFVLTHDAQADGVAEAGLAGLSAAVNARTSAVLAAPIGLDPDRDDLSVFPLLYWRIEAGGAMPDGAALGRLAEYLRNGGIVLFDTADADSPNTEARTRLARIGAALGVPALAPLTARDVLSRSFYLLRDWPGRLAGPPPWVERDPDLGNDGVSPVVIGGNDYAGAWATDAAGGPLYDVGPGGQDQRTLALRFGINLVMIALTGSYKADQARIPELLRRMAPADPP